MKITLIGGGAFRAVAIFRSAMAVPGVLDDGEICLYDLNTTRSEAVGRVLRQSPECRRSNCRITWGQELEASLEGADAVGVIMAAAPHEQFLRSGNIANRYGYISSDNVSPMGAFCALNIGPLILDFARKMEELCPDAWLIDFVNPVAVLSGMVNNHTCIRALGVCQGYTNHYADIPRIFGRDEEDYTIEAETAGINHLSFIRKARWRGRDLFEQLDEVTGPDWKMPKLDSSKWNENSQANIAQSVSNLVRFWREYGLLIFSTEGDGMDHLMYEEAVAAEKSKSDVATEAAIQADLARRAKRRDEADKSFQAYAAQELDDSFWAEMPARDGRFGLADHDVFVRIFTGLSGVRDTSVVTSRLNEGAIAGIKSRHVVEYSQIVSKDAIRPAGNYDIPDVAHGLMASMAAHQTLLGDAIVSGDPRELAHALLSYPMRPYSSDLRGLCRETFGIFEGMLRPEIQKAEDFIKA